MKPTGDLVLSGILTIDDASVIAAMEANGFEHLATAEERDWCCIHLRRRQAGLLGGTTERVGHASSSMSAVTADSVSGMPRSAARLSAMCSSRRIRPATASLVIGGSAS